MKRYLMILVLILGGVLLTSCGDRNGEDDFVEVIDFVDDKVRVPKNPKKVAVVARSAVDMLVSFGLGENIDGVYKTIFDNPWASYLYPDLDDYYSYEYNENYETFYEREIDLIIAPEKHIAEDLRSKGLTAITVSQYGTPTYEAVLYRLPNLIKEIWDDQDVHDKVDYWINNFDLTKKEITSKLENVETKNETLYYIRGDKYGGLNYTETKGSIIETFGNYLNLKFLGEFFNHNNRPQEEEVISLNPSYIITGGIYQNQIISELYDNSVWNKLDAVKQDKVFNIGIGFVMFEQSSVTETIFLQILANNVYPELFNFDINQNLYDIVNKYFNVKLTNEEIGYMLNGLDREGNSLVKNK